MTIIETADEARKRKADEAAAVLVGSVILAPLESWLLMLLAGGLHSTWAVVPAIGYGPALLLILAVMLAAHLTGKFRRVQ